MNAQARRLQVLLADLERELRRMALWQEQAPAPQALASTQPFCIDTLDFNQWLQFVFVARLTVLVTQQLPLPTNCQVAPMGEEFLRSRCLEGEALLKLLREVDALLS